LLREDLQQRSIAIVRILWAKRSRCRRCRPRPRRGAKKLPACLYTPQTLEYFYAKIDSPNWGVYTCS
jgi:hypothetical protein